MTEEELEQARLAERQERAKGWPDAAPVPTCPRCRERHWPAVPCAPKSEP